MRAAGRRALVGALLLAGAAAALAKIEVAHIWRDDRPLIPITEPFGFGSRGHIDVTVRDIQLFRRHDQLDTDLKLGSFGFFLAQWDAAAGDAAGLELLTERCVLEDKETRLFTFADDKVVAVIEGRNTNVTFHVDLSDGGVFAVFFANCGGRGVPVSLAVRTEMYNLVGPSGRRDYLSVGEGSLDEMYWVMFALFSLVTAVWAAVLLRAPRAAVQKVHWLMLLLAALKALTLLAQAIMVLVVERQGAPHGWNWVFHALAAARGLLFFTVVVLIGTGWSLMKPFLDDNTRRVLLVVVPLQVFANIAIVVTAEESRAVRDWLTWRAIFYLLDVVCCCALLFPIVWSIKHLRDAAASDGKAARCLEKLRLFRSFYICVVVFIYFTRIVVYLLRQSLEAGRYSWVADAAYELAYLAFYVWVGVSFRPAADNPYTRLTPEEIEVVKV